MARYTVVIDRMSDWRWGREGLVLVAADDFLTHSTPKATRAGRVINLCRRYEYLSGGYYVSLLAEARREVPMPTVGDILDLSRKSLYAFALPELEQVLNKTVGRLAEPPTADFTLHVFFGRPDAPAFKALARAVFDVFRYPLLKLRLHRKRSGHWVVRRIQPMGPHQVTKSLSGTFEDALKAFTRAPVRKKARAKPALYDLAILHDPSEALPPSDRQALERFIRAGREQRVEVELITQKDYHRIAEYDALFIRETTALDHHTFRFARKAETEGMPVIDDPASILRCTNKVFMAELLAANDVPGPRTIAVNRSGFGEARAKALEDALGYPMVVKIPDGSFSRGVVKAENRGELLDLAGGLLERSRIVLAQEFMYTAYDWRIGILDGEPLFACQYTMSRNHWQIYRHKADGSVDSGGFKTFAVEDAPADVIDIARRAAALIGGGLYGIDLKQNDRGVFVIEINDNPNIDHGVEDKVLKGDLYARVIRHFIDRIEANLRG